MRRLTTIAVMLLLATLLALPAVAAQTAENPRSLPPQAAETAAHKTEVFKRWQNYVQKREAMKQHRDQAMRKRDLLISTDRSGNTGL